MLHIDQGNSAGSSLTDKSVQDDLRKIRFTFLGSMAMGSIRAFKLEWASRSIPVTVHLGLIGEYEKGYLLYTDPNITGSYAIADSYGVVPYHFESEEEALEARSIARECLLVFGEAYNGLNKPEGRYRVRNGSNEVTLNDFGYRPA